MLRAHNGLPLAILVLALLFTSCESEDQPIEMSKARGPEHPLAPVEPTPQRHRLMDSLDPLFGLEVADCGELHNDILRAFDRRHSFADGPAIDEKTYRRIMVDAANDVLSERNIGGRVTLDDLNFLARQGHQVAAARVQFHSHTAGRASAAN